MIRIPDRLHAKASTSSRGRAWLDELPDVCARLSDQWMVRLGEPYADCHISLVTPADGARIPAVLKIPMPSEIEVDTLAGDYRDREAAALRIWAGNGATELLEHDEATGAVLVERCVPGAPLDTLDRPEDADEAAVAVLDLQYLLFRKGDLRDPESEWQAVIERFCGLAGIDGERVKAWTFVRLVSDVIAACEQGQSADEQEVRQGGLWTARLVHRLLN